MPSLIVKSPNGTETVELGDDAVTLGRTADNTVQIPGTGASRKHAQILFVGKGWELVDLGSRNGTLVNGSKVARAMLQAGDVVTIGEVEITFQDGAGASAAADDDGLDIEELDFDDDDDGLPAAVSRPSPSAAAAAPTGACQLKIVGGERNGETVDLTSVRTTFGRRASNTLTFKESAVSGVHAEISREANGYVMRDLGSTNGTVVDGEPVVETILRHNARIQMGAQKMIFIDTSVADIESTLTADDFEGDWGMMRGEIDVTAKGRGGGVATAVAVLFVAAAGAAGFWALNNQSGADLEVADVPDNRIQDWSFEDGISLWFPGDDESAMAQVVGSREKPEGASGVYALQVSPTGEGAGGVTYSGGEDGGVFPVTPETAYEVSAKIGSGKGAVVVRWLPSSRGVPAREVSTPVTEGGSWESSDAVVVAPAQAGRARLELVAFGGMAATFDDVVFKRADGGGAAALKSGDLVLRTTVNGQAEAVRGGSLLFTAGGFAPNVDATPSQMLGGTFSGSSGQLADGKSYTLKIESSADGALIDCSGAGGAFTFTCPVGLSRGAVTLVMAKSARVLSEEETVDQEGVRKVIIGGVSDGPSPFVLSAAPGSEGFHFTSRRTGRGLRIQMAAAEGAEDGAIRLAVDLSREDEAASAVYKQAEEHRTRKELGKAIEAFNRVAVEWHYLPRWRDRAVKERDGLESSAEGQMSTLRKSADSAKEFGDVGGLERVVGDCRRFAQLYDGHALADEARALAAEAEAALNEARSNSIETLAERLYRRASDYDGMGRKALALHLFEEVVRVAPADNEWAEAAGEKIPELKSELAKVMKGSFE